MCPIFVAEVREPPDVAEPHGDRDAGEEEVQGVAPVAPLLLRLDTGILVTHGASTLRASASDCLHVYTILQGVDLKSWGQKEGAKAEYFYAILLRFLFSNNSFYRKMAIFIQWQFMIVHGAEVIKNFLHHRPVQTLYLQMLIC